MKIKAMLVVGFMLLMALAIVVPAEEDDAALENVYIEGGNVIKVNKSSGGTLTLCYSSERNYTSIVNLVDRSTGVTLWSENVSFRAVSDGKIGIPLNTADYPSDTTKMKITFENKSVYDRDIQFTIEYTTSVWGQWTTYAAIIIVVLLIVVFVVYKSRTAPKQTDQLTFEQVEAEKQAQKSAPKEEKQTAAKSERQRYLASKKK